MTLNAASRELLSAWPGRIGAAMLVLFALLSVFIVLRFPRDFGARWSNPAQWADNPKAVPPAWTNLFRTQGRFAHQNALLTEPATAEDVTGGRIETYDLPFSFKGGESPSFVSVSIGDVSYQGAPPLLTVLLVRPDAGELTLNRVVTRGPREDEQPPIHRFDQVPLRISLTNESSAAEALSAFFMSKYGQDAPAPALRRTLAQALVSTPDPSNGSLRPLPGSYVLRVRTELFDPRDRVGSVRFVLGGTVFGLMGTDNVGRDLAQGLAYGLPVALFIGIFASIFTTAVGTALGVMSGYMGGVADMLIQRLSDIVNNVPTLPLLIFLIFLFGSNLFLIMFFLIAFGWPGLAIVVRTMVLQLRSGPLVESALAMGASKWRIMYRHVFPQTAPFVLAQMIFLAPAAILAEAGLSFLGLGDPSRPTWGQILEQGFQTGSVFVGYWWWVFPPGILIIITALTFMLLSLGLEPVVNPRLRRSR